MPSLEVILLVERASALRTRGLIVVGDGTTIVRIVRIGGLGTLRTQPVPRHVVHEVLVVSRYPLLHFGELDVIGQRHEYAEVFVLLRNAVGVQLVRQPGSRRHRRVHRTRHLPSVLPQLPHARRRATPLVRKPPLQRERLAANLAHPRLALETIADSTPQILRVVIVCLLATIDRAKVLVLAVEYVCKLLPAPLALHRYRVALALKPNPLILLAPQTVEVVFLALLRAKQLLHEVRVELLAALLANDVTFLRRLPRDHCRVDFGNVPLSALLRAKRRGTPDLELLTAHLALGDVPRRGYALPHPTDVRQLPAPIGTIFALPFAVFVVGESVTAKNASRLNRSASHRHKTLRPVLS